MERSLIIALIVGLSVVGLSSTKTFSHQSDLRSNLDSNNGAQATKSPNNNSELVSRLILAATQVERIQILDKNSDFVFDYLHEPPSTEGKGGYTVSGNRGTFPALTGSGIAMNVGFIGPCGMNTPHSHPRANEISYAVNGSFASGFILEDARQVTQVQKAGSAIFFPQGSIHWQANLGCDPVMIVVVFNNEDPGILQTAQNFFGIDEEILSATLGGVDSDTINHIASMIPESIALGLQECLKTCGLE
jgi:oxalate decarboxylase/phosphoglucose isomerase-like protein (cupin superfamily)